MSLLSKPLPSTTPSTPSTGATGAFGLLPLYLTGVLLALGLTAVFWLTAAGLGSFEIVGPGKPFAYPWRLKHPTFWSHFTAWFGYALHNTAAWFVIAAARRHREKPLFAANMRWFNWAMLVVHLVGFGLHWLQSRLWYDGLAQDVPEVTALGSVALMLMVVLILETPRRGLAFGKRVSFPKRFLRIVREYHGYLFTWALIYTFWYHPAEATPGHLLGFLYMFLLLGQSVLLFHRGHTNKWWTLTLELLVLPHGALVAYYQGKGLWPMFAFGFGAMFVLTQVHGLGWERRWRWLSYVLFVLVTLGVYLWIGRFSKIHEIVRIPMLDYLVVGLLYGLFLLADVLFWRRKPSASTTSPNRGA